MTQLETLIQTLCPNGVKFVKLGEVGEFYGGLSGKTKEDFKDGNAKFITYKNIYSNLSLDIDVEDKVFVAEGEKQNTVLYGDVLFTGSSETPDECGMSSVLTTQTDEKLYLNSFCFGFRLFDKSIYLPDFLKYIFRTSAIRKEIGKTASGVTRFNVSKKKMQELQIPLPPLAVQSEIVRVLDKFTLYKSELAAELAARLQQYEYYRDKLLTFDDTVKRVKLGEVAEVGTGSSNGNEAIEGGAYPFFVRSKDIKRLDTYEYDEEAIIIPGEGGIGDIFHYVHGKFALHQRVYRIHFLKGDINTRFAYFYLCAKFKTYIMRKAVSATVTSIRKPMIENFELPLPPLSEQERIVSILDRFDKLCHDIREGLPAEIELRQKQYEHYRDKLLTFNQPTPNPSLRAPHDASVIGDPANGGK